MQATWAAVISAAPGRRSVTCASASGEKDTTRVGGTAAPRP